MQTYLCVGLIKGFADVLRQSVAGGAANNCAGQGKPFAENFVVLQDQLQR